MTTIEATYSSNTPQARPRARVSYVAAAKGAFDVTRRAREPGVLVSAWTDGQGAIEEGSLLNLHSELQLLVSEAGLRSDPTKSRANTRDIAFVVKRGRIVE